MIIAVLAPTLLLASTNAVRFAGLGGQPSAPLVGDMMGQAVLRNFPQAATYTLTFGEGGLPSGTNWSVTCNGTTIASTAPQINFTESSGNYSYSVGPLAGFDANRWSGYVLVQSSNTFQGIFFTPHAYALTFAETGLGANLTWAVFIGTQHQYSMAPNVTFVEPNGSYTFSIAEQGSYIVTPSSGTVNITGSNVTVNISFVSDAVPTYTVTFTESGLPGSTLWEVYLSGATGGSTSSTIRLNVSNGSYYYVAYTTFFPGTVNWISNDSTGNVTVSGSNISIVIYFYAAPYTVTFVEAGLPSPGLFEAALDGLGRAGAGTVSFAEASGSFPYQVFPADGLYPSPENGTVVVNGGDISVEINFGPPSSPVVFTESGLPAGTNWSIDVNGTTRFTTATFLTFSLTDGTYNYSVPSVPGFATPTPGSFTVAGGLVSVLVNFTQDVFSLTFHESGLPPGTDWGVVIGSETESGASSNLTFYLANGVYGFLVIGIAGYVYTTSSPAVVAGAPSIVSVAFSLQTYPIVFVQFGLPAGSNWSATVANKTLGVNETQSSVSDSITFFLPNGTYSVGFGLPPGFQINSTESEFTVAGGGDHSVPVSGTPPGTTQPPGKSTPTSRASTGLADATILEIGLVIAVVAVLAVLLGRRSRPPGTMPASDPRSPYYPYFVAVREEQDTSHPPTP